MSSGEPSVSSSRAESNNDVVAAFHTSFHHTQGNTLDWSSTVDDGRYATSLSGVEFSSLPSGLHGVEVDVVYFVKDGLDAVSIFRRRKLPEAHGKRGYSMEAFGVFLGPSPYPRPWRHVTALQEIHDREALESYFHDHKYDALSPSNIPQTLSDWESELSVSSHPLLQLPYLLRVIGPSFLTIFKYVLARKRVLLYTNTPVQIAGLLAKCCIDVAFGEIGGDERGRPSSPDDRRPKALGTVGLIDIDMLKAESSTGLGWTACTTDALFLERPALYDLIVDLTTITPSISALTEVSTIPITRPNLYIPTPPSLASSSASTPKLQQVRFTFSDIRLWSRIDRILRCTATTNANQPNHIHTHVHQSEGQTGKTWMDSFPWRLFTYEDVCLVCGSLWMSGEDFGGGRLRLDGPDVALLENPTGQGSPITKTQLISPIVYRRKSTRRQSSQSSKSTSSKGSDSPSSHSSREERRSISNFPPELHTPMLLLDLFHSHVAIWVGELGNLIETAKPRSKPDSASSVLATDMARLQLSAFSEMDSRFVESLAKARFETRVVVRRGWKDLAAAVVGL
ncbi:hypothetical protein FRB93_006255 [Tulasnella sp. JGI-2019a]|nr:hypothetical protein FRB93_006255 [Tulasnella sp. JGI-2019a]